MSDSRYLSNAPWQGKMPLPVAQVVSSDPYENGESYTRIQIKAYKPDETVKNSFRAWSIIQARNALLDLKAVDRFVSNSVTHLRGGTPFIDNSKTVSQLMGLSELDALGKRVTLENAFGNPRAYGDQIAFQGQQAGRSFKSLINTPQSFAKGVGQFAHASFTKPFTDILAGNNVLSSSLSALASVMFGVDIATKTHRAHKSAYNEGQRDGELWLTTAGEFGKETAKNSASWVAGSAGAALASQTFGMDLGFIKEGSRFARLKSLPTRLMAIAGGVLASGGTNATLDWLFPSRPVVDKINADDLDFH
jgi:hypothetical protein